MPKIDRNGVKIHYEVYGDGPALILTHGYSSTSAMWEGQIEALSKHHKLVCGTCAATASPITRQTRTPIARP